MCFFFWCSFIIKFFCCCCSFGVFIHSLTHSLCTKIIARSIPSLSELKNNVIIIGARKVKHYDGYNVQKEHFDNTKLFTHRTSSSLNTLSRAIYIQPSKSNGIAEHMKGSIKWNKHTKVREKKEKQTIVKRKRENDERKKANKKKLERR